MTKQQDKQTKTKKARTLVGRVVKVSSTNTIKVRVERKQPHPLYQRIVASHKNYLVDCTAEQQAQVSEGQLVEIAEIRPVSKRKSWKLAQVMEESK